MFCFGCGVEKDMSVLETYPYPEDDRLCEDPIWPLFSIEVQPTTKGETWRVAVFCHECFKKLDPDMWISERCWELLNPTIPFNKLPYPIENLDPVTCEADIAANMAKFKVQE